MTKFYDVAIYRRHGKYIRNKPIHETRVDVVSLPDLISSTPKRPLVIEVKCMSLNYKGQAFQVEDDANGWYDVDESDRVTHDV